MIGLIILDGWGLAPAGPANAVQLADTPTMDRLWAGAPHTSLEASGLAVGLPKGQMGNSEVGHLNLGAGRVALQSLVRINQAIADGSFFTNPQLVGACRRARGKRLHLLGLVSEGGVHSSLGHLLALLDLAKDQGGLDVVVHAITDGRDTPPGSAQADLARVQDHMDRLGVGHWGSVMGRYYAMDRDGRWERTARALAALAGQGPTVASWRQALEAAAGRTAPNGEGPETDEFVLPTAVVGGAVHPGDVVIVFNWRADRMRQLTRALTDPGLDRVPRVLPPLDLVGMCPYDAAWPLPAAFPGMDVADTLGEVVSRAGLTQLRVAETEKYAHVTYFFNGGRQEPSAGEQRILVPSPKVATYDLAPEMSAAQVAAETERAVGGTDFGLVVVNFANPDMVGHTGVLAAARLAVEAADRGLNTVLQAILGRGGAAVVLADHGNAEVMVDPQTGGPHTAHTTNPVPCVLVGRPGLGLRSGGCLGDVAPTLLELMGLEQPAAMTGRSLIVREDVGHGGDR